jgi:8-oxo-dGTP diphosphatase
MKYKFCPKCGGKLRINKKSNPPRLQCSDCDFVFYQNPKPTASALIVDEDMVLIGKRKIRPSKGKWDVIGGFLEEGEHPETGMKREVREESGLEVEVLDRLDFIMDKYGIDRESTLNIAYIVSVKGGKIKPGDDISELRWFKIGEYPKNIAFKNGEQMLRDLEKWHSQRKK